LPCPYRRESKQVVEASARPGAVTNPRETSRSHRQVPNFGFDVPSAVSGIDSKLLRPRDTWTNKAEYDETAKNLLRMFRDNFRKFEDDVDPEVKSFAWSA
jgi:ATP-dependent phosphoenolpyruvate carboxykinase